MKKLVALLLAIVLCLSLCACGKSGNEGGSSQAGSAAFVKPENYASVLVVSINPELKLYLDKDNNVLAVEPVNDDAKAVVEKLDIKNKKIDAAVKSIITVSKDEGFVKEGVTVSIKVSEVKDTAVSADTIADLAKQSTNETLTELKITAEVKTETVGYTHSDPINSDPANSQHHHEFSKATCTEPAKCACGETKGKAIPHNYVSGVCTVCKAADPNYVASYTSVKSKTGKWSVLYINGTKLYDAEMILTGEMRLGVGIGDPISEMEPEVQEDMRKNKDEPGYKDSYFVHSGKDYWFGRGNSGDISKIAENKNTVTITLSEVPSAQIVLERTGENTLKVKQCSEDFKGFIEDIPVGTVFQFKSN